MFAPSAPPGPTAPSAPRPASLPNELWVQVLGELGSKDLAQASLASRQVRAAALDARLGLRRGAALAAAHDAYEAALPERRRPSRAATPAAVVLPERRRAVRNALQRHLGEVGPHLFARDASAWLGANSPVRRARADVRDVFVGELNVVLRRGVSDFAHMQRPQGLLCAEEILAVLGAVPAAARRPRALRTLAERVRARICSVGVTELRRRSKLLVQRNGPYPLGAMWTLVATAERRARYEAMVNDANWQAVAGALSALLPLGAVAPHLARIHALQVLADVLEDADVAALTRAKSPEVARRRRQTVVALLRHAFTYGGDRP